MHPSILLSLLPLLMSLTSALLQANEHPGGHDTVKEKRHYTPTSVLSNSEFENFDRNHGNDKRHDMPSKRAIDWPVHAHVDKSQGNYKRYNGTASGMPSDMPSGAPHPSNHGDYKPSSFPTLIPEANHRNPRRQEAIPSEAPSYWSNHDNHKPNPSYPSQEHQKRLHTMPPTIQSGTPRHYDNHSYGLKLKPSATSAPNAALARHHNKRHGIVSATPAAHLTYNMPTPTSTSIFASENHDVHMGGDGYERAEPDLILSYTPLANTMRDSGEEVAGGWTTESSTEVLA